MEKQQNKKKKRKSGSVLKNILKNCCVKMNKTSQISVKSDAVLSISFESVADPKLSTTERKSMENSSELSFRHRLNYSEPNYCIDPIYEKYYEFKQMDSDVTNRNCDPNEMKNQFEHLPANTFTKYFPENEQFKLTDENFKNCRNNPSNFLLSHERIIEQPLEIHSTKFSNENMPAVKKFEANNSQARFKEKLLQILYITLKTLLFMNGNSEVSAGNDVKYEILKLFQEDTNNRVLEANKNTAPTSPNNSLAEYDNSEEDISNRNSFILTQNIDYVDIAERNLSTAKHSTSPNENDDIKTEKKKIVRKRIGRKPIVTKRIVRKKILDVDGKPLDKIPEKVKSDSSATAELKKTKEKKTTKSSSVSSAEASPKQKTKILEADRKPKTEISKAKPTESSSSSSSDKSINKRVAFNLNAEPFGEIKVSSPPRSYKLGDNVLTVNVDKIPSPFRVESQDLSSLKLILKQPGGETDQHFTKIDICEISPEEVLFPEQSIKTIRNVWSEENAKVILISSEDSENRKKPSVTILSSQFDDRRENEIVEKSLADKSLIILPMPKNSGKFKTGPTMVAVPATDKSSRSIKSKDKTVTVLISPSPSQLSRRPIPAGSVDKKWSDLIRELGSSLPSSVSQQPMVIVVHRDSEYASQNIPLDHPEGSKTWPIVFVPSLARLPRQDIIQEETIEDSLHPKTSQPTIVILPSKSEHTLIKIDDQQTESFAISAIIPEVAETYRNFEITAHDFSLKSEITYDRSGRTPKTSVRPTLAIQTKKSNIDISTAEVSSPFENRVIIEKIGSDLIRVKSMVPNDRQREKYTENSERSFRKKYKRNKRITNKTDWPKPGCIIVSKPKQFLYDFDKRSKMTTIRYPNNVKFSLKSRSNSERKSETQKQRQNTFFDMNEGMEMSQIPKETFEKEIERNRCPQIRTEISQNIDGLSKTKLDLSIGNKSPGKTDAKSIVWSTSVKTVSNKCRKKTYAQLLQERMEARRRKEQNDDDDLNTMLDSLIVALHQGEK